jgi:hypothetical protein
MSTKYKHGDAIPIDVIARRLEELSDAVVARMNCDNAKFEREFTCRIPAELDRDADVVLSEASLRLSKQQERIAELEQEKKLMIDFARNIFIGSIEQFNQIVESKLKAVQSD